MLLLFFTKFTPFVTVNQYHYYEKANLLFNGNPDGYCVAFYSGFGVGLHHHDYHQRSQCRWFDDGCPF